ncbi:MATE efflux family protein [Opisthorchis viverrini]|uniref:Multidrug and toxin extrusion protein n=1 Tax=Opisthorchis viverrini TaxID=6198 RepID=A0A1S8X0Q4_OPIVI|nr:MATE efflux family protein [Opisthorchis viverrini]
MSFPRTNKIRLAEHTPVTHDDRYTNFHHESHTEPTDHFGVEVRQGSSQQGSGSQWPLVSRGRMLAESDEERQQLLPGDIRRTEVPGIEIPDIVHTGWLGRFFPFGFCYEFKKLVQLALPITITSLIAFLSGPISIIFCGRLGKSALATVGLAVSLFNVTGFAVITGLLTAADTLFSQTFGSQDKWKMGIQLQRAFAIVSICCFPCAALHLLAEPILRLLKQDPVVAKAAADYLLYMVPGLWFAAYAQMFTKYIQTQNRVLPPLFIGIATNALNALLHYVLLFVVKTGVKGSAISQVAAYAFQCVVLLSYILVIERRGVTWNGWTNKLWLDWGTWFKLAMPGIFMTTLEWSIFEMGSIVAGTIGEKELATQAILFNVESMCFTLLLPLLATVWIWRGCEYSIGALSWCRLVSWTEICPLCSTGDGLVDLNAICTYHRVAQMAYSENFHDRQLAASLLPLVAAFQIFDGSVGVCSGAIRGAGLQFIGAAVCFVTLYVIGGPIGLCLVFLAGMKLNGLWAGLTVGTILEGLVYFTICQCINWDTQVILARERTKVVDSVAVDAENEAEVGCQNAGYISDQTSSHFLSTAARYISANNTSVCFCVTTAIPFFCFLDDDESISSPQIYHRPATIPAPIFVDRPTKFRKVMASRVGLIVSVVAIFIVAACLRAFPPWSKSYGSLCLLPNGTYVSVSRGPSAPPNCATFLTEFLY